MRRTSLLLQQFASPFSYLFYLAGSSLHTKMNVAVCNVLIARQSSSPAVGTKGEAPVSRACKLAVYFQQAHSHFPFCY